jgi:hypothetical protein
MRQLPLFPPPPTGAGKPAGIGLVDLAIVHNAIYDAVNAIAGYPFEPYEVIPTVTMPASSEAAVATAGTQYFGRALSRATDRP